MSLIWNNFWLVAFLVPAIWALAGIMDTYFVKDIYKDENDGVIIFGIFNVIPLIIALVFMEDISINIDIFTLGTLGGILRSLSILFYFRAIAKSGDMSLIQLIWNLSIIIVPLSMFLFLGERLDVEQYIGIGIVFLSTMILSFGGTKENLKKIFMDMMLSTIFFSSSFIVGDIFYKSFDFASGFFMFSLGSFLFGMFFFILRTFQNKTGHLVVLGKDNFKKFFFAEFISILGGFLSQRAIFLSEENLSVSYVSLIDCLTPIFVILEGWVLYIVFKIFFPENRSIMEKINDEQMKGLYTKVMALCVMIVGISFLRF